MWDQILRSLRLAIALCWNWFFRIFQVIPGAFDAVYIVIMIAIISKIIISPLLGSFGRITRSGASDRVRKRRNNENGG